MCNDYVSNHWLLCNDYVFNHWLLEINNNQRTQFVRSEMVWKYFYKDKYDNERILSWKEIRKLSQQISSQLGEHLDDKCKYYFHIQCKERNTAFLRNSQYFFFQNKNQANVYQ